MDRRTRRLTVFSERPTPRAEKSGAAAGETTPPEIEPGAELGDFLIGPEIERCRTGVVYQARQRSRERTVRLKVLFPALSGSPPHVARFHEEADLAARVAHPAIAPLYAFGAARGLCFYASKLLEGPTLAEFLEQAVGTRGEAFFRDSVLRFAGLARAADELHRSGILHRRIEPRKLHLEGDRLVLGDFEMAFDWREPGLRPEEVFRSSDAERACPYLAPEEFVKGSPLDPRADIYAIGMCLYELLTGILPFPPASAEELARLKLTRLPIAIRRLNPDVPLGLEAVVRQAIEASANLRHPSAADLAEDLERFAARKRGDARHHEPPASGEGGAPEAGEDLPDPAPLV